VALEGDAAGYETENSLGTRAGGWMGAFANEGLMAWEREQQAEQVSSKSMEERVQKAAGEFRKNPEAVSKKTERRPSNRWE
jgi:hypothetical protein